MVSLKHLIDLTISRAYDPTFSWSCFFSNDKLFYEQKIMIKLKDDTLFNPVVYLTEFGDHNHLLL